MTKVIKGEFEKIKDVKVEDVLLTCDASLEVFNNEVSRLSRMDDDLFTYEVEVANIPCDSKMDNDSKNMKLGFGGEIKKIWDMNLSDIAIMNDNHEHNKSKELCEVHEQPVCNIRRYMMIKYSFNDDEEYVAVKEDEYDDLTVYRKEAYELTKKSFKIWKKDGW
ncbi:hypothetical protein Tco_1019869 [Tanacetum coccineum]|uniref:Uncharacterized protein n=1 Tax=Tanacetum coccineum TaxID=301880 RepID=A0ABQ5G011_9ASTR